MLVAILKVTDESCRIQSRIWSPDPNPDPLVRGSDPQIRIRPKRHGSAALAAGTVWVKSANFVLDAESRLFEYVQVQMWVMQMH